MPAAVGAFAELKATTTDSGMHDMADDLTYQMLQLPGIEDPLSFLCQSYQIVGTAGQILSAYLNKVDSDEDKDRCAATYASTLEYVINLTHLRMLKMEDSNADVSRN